MSLDSPETSLSSGHLKLLTTVNVADITGVDEDKTFNYYGSVTSLLEERLKFISQEVTNTLIAIDTSKEHLALQIRKTLESFLNVAFEDCRDQTPDRTSACWLAIRLTKPNDSFAIPRWHQDGIMFDLDANDIRIRSKYGTALLGATTLFLDLPQSEEIDKYCKFTFDATPDAMNDWTRSQLAEDGHECMHYRDVVAKFFKHNGYHPVNVKLNQVARFSWGDKHSPVHSEPNIQSDRAFLSVLFGNETEIRAMCESRGELYEE